VKQLDRAGSRAKAGNHAKAAAEAEALAADPKAAPSILYEAACGLALASAAAKPAEATAGSDLAAHYATRAVELLGRAAARGYFQEQARIDQLRKDSDLDPLRERPDYQQFAASLALSKKDPAPKEAKP